ncbi:MAG: hypothetical protein ACE5HC_08625 [Candidatus Binatia bacterium]
MKTLQFSQVALSLSVFGGITFTLCILWDLAFPTLAMTRLWEILLPGFKGISWDSYFLGLAEVILYGVYTAVVFVPTFNLFRARTT